MHSAAELIADPIATYPQATVACFDPTTGDLPRRQLDVPRTMAYLERLGQAGAPAVLIAASTGHGHLRTVEELETWFRAAADANLPNTMRIALLRPEDGQATNERLLDLLAELRYPVVFFRPGTNLSPQASDEFVAESLRPFVASAARRGLAVGLYSIPDVSGLPLSAAAAARLVQAPGGEAIVAVKITVADCEHSTAAYLAHPALRRLKVVQGWDPHLLRALREGGQRSGVTSGPMALAVYQYLHILAAAEQHDWAEVEAAQQAVTLVFQAMQDDPQKFADLQRAKYLMGLGQPTLGTVTKEQYERVLTALENVPRQADRQRLARSLDLMQDGPFHQRLQAIS